jgi:hypothetical protein
MAKSLDLNLTPTDAAYIAGIMDGEGCFMLAKSANSISPAGVGYKPLIELAMCDAATIFYIADLTGKPVQQRVIKSGRTAYKIIWHNRMAGALLTEIIPYLRGKRDQAEILLHYINNVSPGKGRGIEAWQLAEAERVRTELKELKKPFALRC